jgi:hypothetical protein
MEDWEQFFVEKSRRRFERERSHRRRSLANLTIVAAVAGLLLAGAIASLVSLN